MFPSQDLKPIIDWDGTTVTRATYSSCFVTTDLQLAADGLKFLMTFRLDQRAAIQGFVLMQDLYAGDSNDDLSDDNKFYGFNTYVGDSPDYT